MSLLTLPTYSQNFSLTGDADVYSGINSSNGDGSLYIRNGGLYTAGLTNLNTLTVLTNNGPTTIEGSNGLTVNVTAGISMTSASSSFFTTTSGSNTISATATDATGVVDIIAAGTGPNSLFLNATNTTSGQITLSSQGASSSAPSILIQSTDATNGYINIIGSGNYAASNPAVLISTPNTTSGQIALVSAGDSVSVDGIYLNASGTSGGNVNIVAAGANNPSIQLSATNAAGQILLTSSGTSTTSIEMTTPGGIFGNATGPISIQSADATNGVKIATVTSDIPVTIGTATSLTTIAGNLDINGTFTAINTDTLTTTDNTIVLNSGNGEIGQDSGVIIRRYQFPDADGTGDVVNNPNPIQESGAFQTGSATPGTLVLAPYASATDNFYVGWWIKVTSGAGINQVRRIKSYVGSTQTATIYETSDNSTTQNQVQFTDGLDLVTAPASGDTYNLYSRSYVASFYSETSHTLSFAALANAPDPITNVGVSTAVVQQYQYQRTGGITVEDQVYNNAQISASASTTLTVSIMAHGCSVGDKVRITNQTHTTPAFTEGVYVIQTVATNTFTVTVDVATTTTSASSAKVVFMQTSYIAVNVIEPFDSDFGGISIGGISTVEDVVIPRTSTALFNLTTSATSGAFLITVANLNMTNGAFSVFSVCSSTTGGSVSRLSTSKGSEGERINAAWSSGNLVQIFHSPAGTTVGQTFTYRCRIFRSF